MGQSDAGRSDDRSSHVANSGYGASRLRSGTVDVVTQLRGFCQGKKGALLTQADSKNGVNPGNLFSSFLTALFGFFLVSVDDQD